MFPPPLHTAFQDGGVGGGGAFGFGRMFRADRLLAFGPALARPSAKTHAAVGTRDAWYIAEFLSGTLLNCARQADPTVVTGRSRTSDYAAGHGSSGSFGP